jgi:hypothetical protein
MMQSQNCGASHGRRSAGKHAWLQRSEMRHGWSNCSVRETNQNKLISDFGGSTIDAARHA